MDVQTQAQKNLKKRKGKLYHFKSLEYLLNLHLCPTGFFQENKKPQSYMREIDFVICIHFHN